MDRYPISVKESKNLELANQILSWCFVIEMIIKVFGLGLRNYAKDYFNIFDALIVLLSLIEIIFIYSNGKSISGGALLAFRGVRLLRVFKLARSWKSLRTLLNKMYDAKDEVAIFGILLLVFLIIFMILGLQFFANTVSLDSNDNIVIPGKEGVSPKVNFDNLYNSFTTVFTLLIGNGWNQIMYPYYRGLGVGALFYFDIAIIVLNIVLLKLFLALLLQKFTNPTEKEEHDQELTGLENLKQKVEIKLYSFYILLDQRLQTFINKYLKWNFQPKTRRVVTSATEQEIIQNSTTLDESNKRVANTVIQKGNKVMQLKDLQRQETEAVQNLQSSRISQIVKNDLRSKDVQEKNKTIQLQGRSLQLFDSKNYVRQVCRWILQLSQFDNLSICMILASTIILTLDHPLDDPNSQMQKYLYISNVVLTVLFSFEAALKIITFGFMLNGGKSYLRSWWNVLDFVVVTISLIDLLHFNIDLTFYKVIRMVRLLRPLRFIQSNHGLKIAVQSLLNAMPGILNLLVISFMIISLFSILAVNFFKGSFYSCQTNNFTKQGILSTNTMWECLDYGGEWVNSDSNFDNFTNALTSQFQMMTTENWVDLFFSAIKSTQQFQMPIENSKPVSIVYFVVVLIFCSQFIVNLFVSEIITSFFREKETLNRNTLLTKLESDYIDATMLCYQSKPQMKYQPSRFKVRDKIYTIATSKEFDFFIFACISLNILLLTLTWYGDQKSYEEILSIINKVFTFIYVIEAVIKLVAFGIFYFHDGWNIMDFAVVVTSTMELLIELFAGQNLTSILAVVRCFKIARVLKLIGRLKELRRILQTFIEALSSLCNVGSLLFLLLYLYAVLGVNLFCGVKLQANLNFRTNFQSFGVALLTLFRASTGENWNYVMNDLARQKAIDFECVLSQTYSDIQKNGLQGCGFGLIAKIYFVSFQIIITFVMLNLFIAIILEGFQKQLDDENKQIQPETMDEFVSLWQKYDPLATGMISIDDLENLLLDTVERELQIKSKRIKIKRRQSSQDVLFNFHHIKLLRLALSWRKKEDDGTLEYRNLKNSVFFQKQLNRHLTSFLGEFNIPTYNKLKHYNFYDTLSSFVKFNFSIKHKEDFRLRQQRIQSFRETGQKLSHLDNIQKYSEEYYMLNLIQRQTFDEMHFQDFSFVVNNIEAKAHENDTPIRKLIEMKKIRKHLAQKNANLLDDFGDIAIDSSVVFGARVIQRFLVQRKENKKLPLERRKGIFQVPNVNKVLLLNETNLNLKRQALLNKKQILRIDIQQKMKETENHMKNGIFNFETSSSDPNSGSSESQQNSSQIKSRDSARSRLSNHISNQIKSQNTQTELQNSFSEHAPTLSNDQTSQSDILSSSRTEVIQTQNLESQLIVGKSLQKTKQEEQNQKSKVNQASKIVQYLSNRFYSKPQDQINACNLSVSEMSVECQQTRNQKNNFPIVLGKFKLLKHSFENSDKKKNRDSEKAPQNMRQQVLNLEINKTHLVPNTTISQVDIFREQTDLKKQWSAKSSSSQSFASLVKKESARPVHLRQQISTNALQNQLCIETFEAIQEQELFKASLHRREIKANAPPNLFQQKRKNKVLPQTTTEIEANQTDC